MNFKRSSICAWNQHPDACLNTIDTRSHLQSLTSRDHKQGPGQQDPNAVKSTVVLTRTPMSDAAPSMGPPATAQRKGAQVGQGRRCQARIDLSGPRRKEPDDGYEWPIQRRRGQAGGRCRILIISTTDTAPSLRLGAVPVCARTIWLANRHPTHRQALHSQHLQGLNLRVSAKCKSFSAEIVFRKVVEVREMNRSPSSAACMAQRRRNVQ